MPVPPCYIKLTQKKYPCPPFSPDRKGQFLYMPAESGPVAFLHAIPFPYPLPTK
ncbi:hypothetical protein HMPREF9446_03108 [Bacteroides fluxus YIT 12057]|uniref:Uncharacterized protein n=1 Tax=Bacteroides fluxus YIT 12057 TaxID=763034 RepID=F3PWH2_9BACE|nr:hypothetical protein HMPREF9446_03108 [Bacteroides fluxus YIT 12057]